jgi:hypothetical protein
MEQVRATTGLQGGLPRRALLMWLGALLACAALAADARFEIRNAFAEPVEGVWQLNANLDIGLSEAALEALAEGIPLTLVLEIEVSRERRFLPDAGVAALEQRWRLAFDALSERYVVTNRNSGAQTTFATLEEALAALAVIRNLPMIDADLLEDGRRHEVSLRATLEIGGLPDAVKVLIFWRDWSRSTEWYTWSIRP